MPITYKVEYSTTSDFSSDVNEATGSSAHGGGASSNQELIISGLSFNTGYYFRVTGTNFEDGSPVSTTTAFSQVGPATQLQNFSVSNDAGPTVVASWPKPLNATQYKLEYRKMGYDQNGNTTTYPNTWQDITGFSGFTESTDSNVTTVSYTFDENNGQLDGNTQYDLRASYSTTTNTGPNTSYTFGDVSTDDGEIITFPDEINTFTVENSDDDANLAYNSLKVDWTQETTDINKHQVSELEEFGEEVIYEIQYDTSSSFANSPNTQSNSVAGVITMGAGNPNFPPILDNNLLSADTTYYFRVRSYNYNGAYENTQYTPFIPDSNSTQISKSTNLPDIPSPSNFALSLDTTTNAHKITAEWTEPTELDYYEYKLEVSTDSSYGTIIGTITSGFTVNEGTVSITIDDSDITGTFSGNTIYYLRASIRQMLMSNTTFGDYGNTSGDNINQTT